MHCFSNCNILFTAIVNVLFTAIVNVLFTAIVNIFLNDNPKGENTYISIKQTLPLVSA